MEEQVWPDAQVRQILTQDVILVSLYVDERTALPEDEQHVESYGGKEFKIKTIGNKWSYMQAAEFNTNSQPFYVMLDHEGRQIGGTAGYDPDEQVFIDFLEDGLAAFNAQ
jgi:thiol:disulfide interchange protein DsbD